jgi:hypothetical protein
MTVTDAREGRVSIARWSLETPCLSIPPLYKSHKFFIGRESLKDVWVNQLRSQEKDIGHEQVKEEFQNTELHDRGGLNLMVIRDTQ